MTTSALINRVRALCVYDLDLVPTIDVSGEPVEATDADMVGFINDAQDRLAKDAPIFDPAIPLTMPVITSGPCTLNLSSSTVCTRRVWKVMDVILNGLMLYNAAGSSKGPWSLAELEGRFPQWRTDAPGMPLRWVRLSDRSIVLHVAPDGSQSATGNFISGHVLPARLDDSAPTIESEMPEELHEHIAKMAAALISEPVATEGRQLAKVQKWQAEAQGAAIEVGARDRSAMSPLGSTSGRNSTRFLRA